MALLTAGYWHTTYWAKDYWNDDYWLEFGVSAALDINNPTVLMLQQKKSIRELQPGKTVTELQTHKSVRIT